jgi:uncharacterized membrane protein YphA (DoxX/SURF4 family)
VDSLVLVFRLLLAGVFAVDGVAKLDGIGRAPWKRRVTHTILLEYSSHE